MSKSKNWYKIPISENIKDWPKYYLNLVDYCEDQVDGGANDDNGIAKLVTKMVLEAGGRFYLENGNLEPKNKLCYDIAGIAFEHKEDATAFILKWS